MRTDSEAPGVLTVHYPLLGCPDVPHICLGEFRRRFDNAPHTKDESCERRGCTAPGHSVEARTEAMDPDLPRRLRVIHSAALTLPCTCRHDHDGVIGLPCARCQIVTEAEGEKL